MYPNTITKAQELLDKVRKLALEIKADADIAWAWMVTPDLIEIEAHVTDFECIYVLSDLDSSFTTTSYQEAISVLSSAMEVA